MNQKEAEETLRERICGFIDFMRSQRLAPQSSLLHGDYVRWDGTSLTYHPVGGTPGGSTCQMYHAPLQAMLQFCEIAPALYKNALRVTHGSDAANALSAARKLHAFMSSCQEIST